MTTEEFQQICDHHNITPAETGLIKEDGSLRSALWMGDKIENADIAIGDYNEQAQIAAHQGRPHQAQMLSSTARLAKVQSEMITAMVRCTEDPSKDNLADLDRKVQRFAAANTQHNALNHSVSQAQHDYFASKLAQQIGPVLEAHGLNHSEVAVVIKAVTDYQIENHSELFSREAADQFAAECLQNLDNGDFQHSNANLTASQHRILDAAFNAVGAKKETDSRGQDIIGRKGNSRLAVSELNKAIGTASNYVQQHGADGIIGEQAKQRMEEIENEMSPQLNVGSRLTKSDERSFTAENRQNVAATHQSLDAIRPEISHLNPVDQSRTGREERQAPRITARESEIQEQQAPAPAQNQSRLGSVRDTLSGAASRVSNAASNLKNAAGERLERRGGEQKLSEVPDHIKDQYKAEQKQMSDLQKAILDNTDPSKMTMDSPANLDQLQDQLEMVKTKMKNLAEDNPGLKQLDRSKVGQVVHSGVRDAAKSIGSKLKS